jgi:hypothetical protein
MKHSKLIFDLSMVSDETLRAIEENLLIELAELRASGEDARHDALAVELRKLEDYFSS